MTRRRARLNGAGTAEKNRVQKILEDANVKLGNVLSDIFGVSGQLMLDALLEGKASVEEIAQLAQRRAKKKIPAVIQALEQHQMNAHHRRMIEYCLEHMKFLEEQIAEIDEDIAEQIRAAGLEEQWKNLQTVPGIQERSAATILAETGADMKQFPTPRNLSSWAGVCPGNNRSADKNRSNRPTGGNPWLRAALTECAWAAAAKKDCFLKEKFWRIAAKSKKQTALLAVAHSVLHLVYDALHTGSPFQKRQPAPISDHQKERLIQHHVRRLGKLGVRVHSHRPAALHPRKRNSAERTPEVTENT